MRSIVIVVVLIVAACILQGCDDTAVDFADVLMQKSVVGYHDNQSTASASEASPHFLAVGKTCQSVWNVDASGYTCGARIEWLERHRGMNDAQAKTAIGNEFPNQCGACKSVGTGTTCQSVWNVDASGYTCGARIEWLERHRGMNDAQAKTAIGNEFPNQCGACKLVGTGKTCQSVWNVDASGYTCGARIEWLERHRGMNDAQAKTAVGNEFPNQCGACKSGDCTGSGQDPWKTGRLVKCCNGLDKVFRDWDDNGNRRYKCRDSVTQPPTPSPPTPSPPTPSPLTPSPPTPSPPTPNPPTPSPPTPSPPTPSPPTPSPPTPSPPVSGKSCSDQWNNKACKGQFGSMQCYTCGERIKWLKKEKKMSDANAKQRVADEFFKDCGSCGAKSGDTDFSDEGYSLVWQDDFDGNGAVDTSKWSHVHSGGGFGNNEKQFYTNRDVNSFVRDGKLTIRAKTENYRGAEYTSAKLESRQSWTYGKFLVRARLKYALARGTWPANWMMPKESSFGGWPRSGEIDIMEHVGYDTGVIHGTVHTQAYHHNIGTQIGGSTSTDVKQWHTYMVEWRPDILLFGMDNRVYQIFRKESDTNIDVWPFKKDFYLILNLAVGGDWGGAKGIDRDAFRGDGQKMEIDWVKVYQKSWR